MIDGLKVTVSGQELRVLLDEGIQRHRSMATRWRDETVRAAGAADADARLLARHISEQEVARHAWRASVLAFIRDHVDARETYCLGAADLEYGELLPDRPAWMQQDDEEERTRIGFALERLVKSLDVAVACLSAPGFRRDRVYRVSAGDGPAGSRRS